MAKKKVLVVVAHPDDEAIWCGGILLRNKGRWDATIVSLCREHDPDRAPRFRAACVIYGAKGFIFDLEDEHPERGLKGLSGIERRLLPAVEGKKFDIVFTHGKNGEYGHNRHREAHRAVKSMALKGKLRAAELRFFSYRPDRKKRWACCVPNARAALVERLSASEARRKKLLITNTYNFASGSFEEMSCGSVEAFDIVSLKK